MHAQCEEAKASCIMTCRLLILNLVIIQRPVVLSPSSISRRTDCNWKAHNRNINGSTPKGLCSIEIETTRFAPVASMLGSAAERTLGLSASRFQVIHLIFVYTCAR